LFSDPQKRLLLILNDFGVAVSELKVFRFVNHPIREVFIEAQLELLVTLNFLFQLPMLEFDDKEDMSLLKDIGEKAHYVTITPQPDGGFRFHIMINYFEEIMSDVDRGLLQYSAIQQDEK